MDHDLFLIESGSFYDILEVERTATAEEIKESYQRLVRRLHPDKRPHSCQDPSKGNVGVEYNLDERFLALQRAWAVLKDPGYRRKYDATLSCREHADLLLYETLVLRDLAYDDVDQIYKYPCRCGGSYSVNKADLAGPEVIVGCDECSFSILVKNSNST